MAVGTEAHAEARLQIRGKSQDVFVCPRRGGGGTSKESERERADGRAGVARNDGVGLCAATDVSWRDGCVPGERSATGRRHLEERHKPIQEMQRHVFCLNQRPVDDATCWGGKKKGGGKEKTSRGDNKVVSWSASVARSMSREAG